MPAPLGGITAVDFSGDFPGVVVSLILVDYGAEVVKAGPPGGDGTRDEPAWYMWHRGKKSVVLDLFDPAAAVRSLSGGAVDLARDPRFVTPESRRKNDAELAGSLGGFLQSRTSEEWEVVFKAREISCVKVGEGAHGTLLLRGPCHVGARVCEHGGVPYLWRPAPEWARWSACRLHRGQLGPV